MFSLSDSGDLVYWRVPSDEVEPYELVWVNRSGGAYPVDPGWTDDFESVLLSSDGTRAV